MVFIRGKANIASGLTWLRRARRYFSNRVYSTQRSNPGRLVSSPLKRRSSHNFGAPSADVFCPTYESAPEGYVVSHLPDGIVEVYFIGHDITKLVCRRKSGHVSEETLFQGLITLHSADQGESGITYTPLSDLASLFPLEVGDEHTFTMQVAFSGKVQRTESTLMRVQSRQRTKIGQCRYDAFTVAVTLDPPGPTSLYYYYCPALRHIVNLTGGSRSGNKGTLYPLSALDKLRSGITTSTEC
jgi:hypothetical protein